MKRFAAVGRALGLGRRLLGYGLLGVMALGAESPDDQFIRVYNLIQQADALRENGQPRAAKEKYQEAQGALERLQADYPSWNEKIVKYRRSYITEKLTILLPASVPNTPAPVTPTPAPVTPTPASAAPRPAPTPPLPPAADERDGQINTLTEEIKRLKADGELLQAKLKEALTAQPAAVDPRELAKAEDRIKELQKENAMLKASAQQERDKRLVEPAARPAPAPRPAAPAPQKEKPAAETKLTPGEKFQIKQLEKERDDLRRKVALLTRQVADRRLRKGDTQTSELADQVAILRARVEAYEARQVPYTAEEQAFFKKTAAVGMGTDSASTKKSRQLPAGAAALVAEAQRAYQAGRYDEAEKKYRQALTLDDRNVAMLTELAAAQMEQNRLEDADATLKKALAEDAGDGHALTLTGLLRCRQQKYEAALEVLARAAQLNPDDAVTQNYLGVALTEKGQRGPAETAFRKAVQLQPGYPEAHYNLAVAYATQKPPFPELARWHYQKALAFGHPKQPDFEKLLQEPTATSGAK